MDASFLTLVQAASAIDTLKMSDSPAKKLDFSSANKENTYKPIVGIPDLQEEDEVEKKFHSVAPTIKPEEADEPILQENPQRFVLFPIKYHDVSPDALDAFHYASRHFCLQHWLIPCLTGLANVQEGRGFLLDRRRDRSLQRPSRLEQAS